MSIAVIGAGAWGTALAQAWSQAGNEVVLIARTQEAADALQTTQTSSYLPGVILSSSLQFAHSLEQLRGRTMVALVTPAQTLPQVLADAAPYLSPNATLILCSKGIDRKTGLTVAQTAQKLLPDQPCTVLSGPSFAHDVARGRPTAVTLAASNMATARKVAGSLSTKGLRLYASDDIAGAEAGGALKNVLALAVGVARGLDLGASAEAALITRGFVEMTRLATAMGAQKNTLSGLSGLGDLVLSCSSPQSRNFAYGTAMGRGESLENRPLAEGVHTARAALALARKAGIEVPIMQSVVEILDGTITPQHAVISLLSRPLTTES